MCGIAGLYNRTGHGANPTLVSRMTEQLVHRGPDAGGLWGEGPIALGHRRLAILDRSAAANQPMHDWQNRYVLTYNGELYNYRSLKAQLWRYPFQTQSDTEVILAAYAQWGSDCLTRFNGMFALAIYDRHTQQLLLARDRLGEKPLYYSLTDSQLLFASEISALLASNQLSRQLNIDALGMYLRYQTVLTPTTLVQGICQLPAGHMVLIQGKTVRIKPYWSITTPTHIIPPPDIQTARVQVRNLLQKVVADRMVSDVPIGAFLSGGMDSGAIVGLMAQYSAESVNTFTLSFTEKGFDEQAQAMHLARRFSTRHHTLRVGATDALALLPTMLAALDTPGADGLNTFMVAKMAKAAGVSVVLSGLGGDELFGGYSSFPRYEWLHRLRWFWQLPLPIRRRLSLVAQCADWLPDKAASWLCLPEVTPEHVFPLFRQAMPEGMVRQLIPDANPANPLTAFFRQEADRLQQLPRMSQTTIGEWKTYAEPLLLRDADQMSMAHALELRLPFFDHELVEYILQLPDVYKTGAIPKQLLADVLHDLLPISTVQQPKMGFSLPWDAWLHGPLQPFARERIDRLAKCDVLSPKAVKDLWKRFLGYDPRVRWNQIWLLIALDDWLARNGII